MTALERKYCRISELTDDISYYNDTVLKTTSGKRKTGKTHTLQYIFEFLSAYNVSSESAGEIQEDNIPAINDDSRPAADKIIENAQKILAAKSSNPAADVSALEAEIDALVYKLYVVTDSLPTWTPTSKRF